MYIRDLNGKEYPVMATDEIEDELNSNKILKATLEWNKVNSLFLLELDGLWTLVDDDEAEWKMLVFDKKGVGKAMKAEIQAIPKFLDDFDSDVVYDVYSGSMTARRAFDMVFEGSGYNYVLVGNFYATSQENFGGGVKRLKLFQEFLRDYSGEYAKPEGNTVYIYERLSTALNFEYRHRLNISNVVHTGDFSAMGTYQRGYGDYEGDKESGDWVDAKIIEEFTHPLAQIVGVRHLEPVKDGRINDVEFMQARLKREVESSIGVSVTANIHDLSQQGFPYQQASPGDTLFLTDETIGFSEEVRIIKKIIKRDWRKRILKVEMTFGTRSLADAYMSNLNGASRTVDDIINGHVQLPFEAYNEFVKQATKDLKNARSELQFPNEGGIHAVDLENPNHLTKFVSSGLGVSEDGGRTFKSAVTGRGVVAETLVGKMIIGNRLQIENAEMTFVVHDKFVDIEGGALRIGGGGLPDEQIKSADQWHGQGTYIDEDGVYTGKLTAEQVQVGFNALGDTVKVFPNRMDFFSAGGLTTRLNGTGHHHYLDGEYGGFTGIIPRTTQQDKIGLAFNMTEAMDYMAWTHDDDGDGTYSTQMLWSKDNSIDFSEKGFNFYDDITIATGNKLTLSAFELEAGTNFYRLSSNNAHMTFNDDGVLSGYDGWASGLKIGSKVIVESNDLQVGSKAAIESSGNAARLKVSNNMWLYINENGQVGVTVNGNSRVIFDYYG